MRKKGGGAGIRVSVVDCGFKTRSCQTNDNKLVFVVSPLSMQQYLRSKSKDWLAKNQNNVFGERHVYQLNVFPMS